MKKYTFFAIAVILLFSFAFVPISWARRGGALSANMRLPFIEQPRSDIRDTSRDSTTPQPQDAHATENIIIHRIAQAVNNARNNTRARNQVLEAEALYNQAFTAFKNSDLTNAQRNFHMLLDRLRTADIDPHLYSFLFNDLNSIVTTLKQVHGLTEPQRRQSPGEFIIPMELVDNEPVERFIRIYTSPQQRQGIQRAFERSGRYREMILRTLREFNLPEELLWLPLVESRFNNTGVSSAGARGLWQFMEHRGRASGLHINHWIDERLDPELATRAAAIYLKELYLKFNNWHLALSGYNRGENGLVRDLRFSNATNITEMRARRAVPRETQNFVPQFIAAVTIAANLEYFGFTNLNFDAPLRYDVITTDKVICLNLAASAAGTTFEELRRLNPALRAWSTPHNYPGFRLRIPYGTRERFLENIAGKSCLNPSPGYVRHRIVQGDTLGALAARYKTTVREIQRHNPGLENQRHLRVGQVLNIRPGRRFFQTAQ